MRSFICAIGLCMPANPSGDWPCQQCLCNLWIRIRTVLLNNIFRMVRWVFCISITHAEGPGHVPFPTVETPAPRAHAMMQANTYCLERAASLQHNIQLSGSLCWRVEIPKTCCTATNLQARQLERNYVWECAENMFSQSILQLKHFCMLETGQLQHKLKSEHPMWCKPKMLQNNILLQSKALGLTNQHQDWIMTTATLKLIKCFPN